MAKENIKMGGAGPTQKGSSDKKKSKQTSDNASGSTSDKRESSLEASNIASDKVEDNAGSKNEGDSPAEKKHKNYVRGENQKPVTKAYRDNWNKIFKKG